MNHIVIKGNPHNHKVEVYCNTVLAYSTDSYDSAASFAQYNYKLSEEQLLYLFTKYRKANETNDTARWVSSIVYKVTVTDSHVYFNNAWGGYVYKCTKEHWNTGTLTEVSL